MPAAVLIVLVLAAMAIDLAHLQLGQRQLRSMAADAANDAAGAGVDVEALRAGQPVQLDPARRSGRPPHCGGASHRASRPGRSP
ncbi:MAG: hypothetical protein R2690_13235 [Acidimicrobiales bacterium]